MEMRSRRASGISGLSDKVAALNPLPFFHRIMRKVSIDRPVAGTVVDLDDFSKTAFSPDVFNLSVRWMEPNLTDPHPEKRGHKYQHNF